jgi:hypothetical protein
LLSDLTDIRIELPEKQEITLAVTEEREVVRP